MAKEKKEKKENNEIKDLDLRISQLEDLTSQLVSRAHICRNCIRFNGGNCTEVNREMNEFDCCGMFTRV